jgi:ubiquinone/menaquinone biosynthesis C-methylase UbiE
VTRTKEEARRLYDRISRWYDLFEGRWERRQVQDALALLAPSAGERLLEIGPGTGWALLRIATMVTPSGSVAALDLSPRMLETAARRLRKAGMEKAVELQVGDVSSMPWGEGEFDGVFMTFVLELLDTPDMPVALAEIGRVVKRGGRFVVVSLSTERDTLMRRLYERGHNRFPRLLDCRPIDVKGSIAGSGFDVESARLASVEGLPVEIVLARRPR